MLNEICFRDVRLESAKEVFEEMVFMPLDRASESEKMKGCPLLGSITFKGAIDGCLAIGNKVLFTGFLRGENVQKMYKMADLFVMPSVSEPFGLVPLEALNNDVPIIISKQSGVSEVLTHALKVDFWDVDEMANKIIAVLKYPPLKITLQNHGNSDVRKLRWKDSATKCMRIYKETLVAV